MKTVTFMVNSYLVIKHGWNIPNSSMIFQMPIFNGISMDFPAMFDFPNGNW
jgi:hypothetical protein